MENIIYFVGWNDENGEYNEVKFGRSKVDKYDKEDDSIIDALPKYVIHTYGRYVWDNMIYLQLLELYDADKGWYKMNASDPNNIYPGTKGKTLIVDEERNIVSSLSEEDDKRKPRRRHS